MEKPNLPNCLCRSVDVTDYDAFDKVVKEAEAQFGPTSLLVNNAGCMLLSAIQDQDPCEWKRMLDCNVLGVLNGMKAVLNGMIERREGTIMNVSSIAGRKTFPDHAAYCGTKFAVHAITENVREETAQYGIRCIIIAPGVTETELLDHTTSDSIKQGYKEWKKEMGQPLSAEALPISWSLPTNNQSTCACARS